MVGLAIAAMHYTGMMAYRVQGIVSWDMPYLVASIVLSVGLSAIALHAAMQPGKQAPTIMTGVLALAIIALHFTGMTALRVEPLLVAGSFSDPDALHAWLRDAHGIGADWRVADIGAGTGISSKGFLDRGHAVVAVEPNAAMREAMVQWLGGSPRFAAVDGRAEATGLDDGAADLVSAAQAFHWFDQQAIRPEWRRILRPRGLVAVYWNSRRLAGTPFLEGYEALLQAWGTDYTSVSERYSDDAHMQRWFGAGLRDMARFAHSQRLDFEQLRGRLLSSSYAPRPGHPRHAPMIAALRALFEATAVDGHVDFDYDTRVFLGAP